MRYVTSGVALFVCAIGFSGTALAHEESLPFKDVRLTEDGRALPAIRAALTSDQTAVQVSAKQAAVQRLSQSVRGLRIDDDEIFGTPHFVRSTEQFLTQPATVPAWTPRSIAKDFVSSQQALFEIAPTELDIARMSRDYPTQHNGITHLTFQQQLGGIDVFGAELRANVTASGELINISSTMLPRPADDFSVAAPVLSPLEAIHAAAADIGIAMSVEPTALGSQSGVNLKQTWNTTPDFRADTPITTELVYFPLSRQDIRPAWALVIPEPGIGNTYDVIVDATNGQILRRENRLHYFVSTQPITMRVYTSDSPAPGSPGNATPNGFQFPFVPRTLVTVNPADMTPYSPNGWIDDGGQETLGNNVDAHTDLDANNTADTPRPNGGASRVFDFPLDTTQAPTTYRPAAVTQLFYLCNVYHDRLYALGFDEASGNFQQTNFSGQGSGGDRVQADVQDGSGTNNANFSTTGSDGSSGRMQMYVFSGPNPDRDGDLDADIVFHEHTHGVSIRLHGGLSGTQPSGMGEGWSDFVGISMLAEASDDPHANFCTGGYATYQFTNLSNTLTDNYYFGIRRFPYSTDMNKNPETYADIDPNQLSFPPSVPRSPVIASNATDEHNIGEIWCTALMECRAAMWDVYGFSGNEMMLQLVIDGMKLSPSNPNMLKSRDAILQADMANNGGANLGTLWSAFAKRGMGYSATSPATSGTGVVEAYNVPILVNFSYPEGTPSQLSPNQAEQFRVVVTGQGSTVPTSGTGQLHYSINGGSFTVVAMSENAPNDYEAVLPVLDCFDNIEFYFTVGTNGGTLSNPSNAPTTTYSASVFTSTAVTLDDNMETNTGWTVGDVGDNATTGIWTRVNPIGTIAQSENDHSATGTLCWVTGQGTTGGGDGDADVDGGKTTLVSPVLDFAGADAYISYWRWYSNDEGAAPNADTFRVDVSSANGASGTWVNVETVGPSGTGTSGGWIFHEFKVSDFVTPSAQVKVRFIAEDAATGSLIEAGVDDFLATKLICEASQCGAADGDFDGSGVLDGNDIAGFVSAVLGSPTQADVCHGDFNGSSSLDADDVDGFVAAIIAAP